MYIPFAPLLGLQAALKPLVHWHKQPQAAPFTDGVHFVDPGPGGGSLLDHDSDTVLGQPLNVIISGQSSAWVLSYSGFVHFANAIGFGIECFGPHLGAPQMANLGDGNGWVNQTIELRNDYGNPDVGSCWESLAGSNHLRMWRQASSNAVFLAVFLRKRMAWMAILSPRTVIKRAVMGL